MSKLISSTGIPTIDCTLSTCNILVDAYIQYQPSYGANGFFLALFIILLVAQVFLGIRYRTWGFLVGMFAGLVLECIGYGGRIKLHQNPFIEQNFLM